MKEIKAKEGMYLTQAAEVQDRIYVTKVKGANIRESDWREATAEEREQQKEESSELDELLND